MKNFFDKRYPVTNGLLAITALVFLLIQVFRFGQTTAAYTIFEFGGMFGEVVRYDPTQLWRLISPIFVHIGLEQQYYLAWFGLSIRRTVWVKAFLPAVYLVWDNGQSFCSLFYTRCSWCRCLDLALWSFCSYGTFEKI